MFHGVKLGHRSPSISHLLFAYDLLLFCRANEEEVKQVLKCLKLFYKWMGQKFNKDKSGCFFSYNVIKK